MKKHNEDKPYKCEHCEYACSNSSYLKKHMNVHFKEKSFKCNQCEYTSSQTCKTMTKSKSTSWCSRARAGAFCNFGHFLLPLNLCARGYCLVLSCICISDPDHQHQCLKKATLPKNLLPSEQVKGRSTLPRPCKILYCRDNSII